MPWSMIVPHGSEVEIGVFNTVTVRTPGRGSVKLRRHYRGVFVLGPITSAGQRLEFRPA